MVTHDVEEAIYFSDRVVVMKPRPGRIAAIFDITSGRPLRRDDPHFVGTRREIAELLAKRR